MNESAGRRKKEPAYLSQSAFAAHLDVSRITIWRWLRAGKLRSVQLTTTITRIPLTEIERMSRETAGKRPSPRKRLGAGQQNDAQGDPTETD